MVVIIILAVLFMIGARSHAVAIIFSLRVAYRVLGNSELQNVSKGPTYSCYRGPMNSPHPAPLQAVFVDIAVRLCSTLGKHICEEN